MPIMTDLTLLFLPQWSPFQPPLSLPSLSAWLRRAGHAVRCIDANILFYHWLLSEDCAEIALEILDGLKLPEDEKDALRATLQSQPEFRRDLSALKNPTL